jgi:low affinity Fe/Cu permease
MAMPKSWFQRLANAASRATGRPLTFALAVAVVVAWAVTGPLFHFSDTWQLVINTGTTIVTFLMVFLIQNTQNRDSEAMHVKMDELIRALEGAHNALLDLEELGDKQLDEVRERYRKLASEARASLAAGGRDIGCAEVELADAAEAAQEGGRKPERKAER